MQTNKKKSKNIIGIIQSVLILILVVLIIFMMIQIIRLQGTARVINYAGLVRGATQREVKMCIRDRHGALRIGYLNQDGGISSVDSSTGKLTGVITDYVDLAENCLQGQTLEFELNGYDTRSELLQALQDGKIDLIFHANQNPYFAETNGFEMCIRDRFYLSKVLSTHY